MGKTMSGRLLFILTAVLMTACGGKYDDAVKVNHEFANATEEYIVSLEKADDAESVAAAIDAYAVEMEKIAPRFKEVSGKYPELQSSSDVPDELAESRQKASTAGQKMAVSMIKIIPYMGDPKVMEAQKRLHGAMALMGTMK